MTGVKGKGKGSEDEVTQLGLEEIFRSAASEEKRAIAVVSKTDVLGENKRAFACKDETVVLLPGPKERQESIKAWLRSTVGWSCNKGKKPEQANQDCLSILLVEQEYALYGVYDGHGPHGHTVSEFACRTLPKLFLQECIIEQRAQPGEAFVSAFLGTQKLIEDMSAAQKLDAKFSGSTCTMAYHCFKSQKLWLAHVGDSRSICGSDDGEVCSALTKDHKPDLPEEKRRIESADPPGRVIFDGYFNHRVFAKNGAYPGLNMSRALGDCVAHSEAGLTAEPDVIEIDLKTSEYGGNGDRLLILCTDGVWEFIENEEALKEVLKSAKEEAPLQKGISQLAKLGYDRWLVDSDNEISDDITGIMIRIPSPNMDRPAA